MTCWTPNIKIYTTLVDQKRGKCFWYPKVAHPKYYAIINIITGSKKLNSEGLADGDFFWNNYIHPYQTSIVLFKNRIQKTLTRQKLKIILDRWPKLQNTFALAQLYTWTRETEPNKDSKARFSHLKGWSKTISCWKWCCFPF